MVRKTFARQLFRGLAAAGVVVAVIFLVTDYLFIYQPVHANVAASLERARNGNHHEQYVLGIQYLTGFAESRTLGMIGKDNKQAVYWLGLAANGGEKKAYSY